MNGSAPGETRRRVPGSLLGERVELPARPRRVVSLVSGLTEAIWAMGLADRVVAVSQYCARYVDVGARTVAGSYLQVDEAALAAIRPDLVLMTGGVQLGVARKLAAAGWPVYVLPLPESFHGILENIRRLGALLGEMDAALALTEKMEREAAELRATAPAVRPRVFAELWFGRHARMAGGLTFIQDLISLAGAENVFAGEPEGYLALDLAAIEAKRPEILVVFWEEDDHAVDVRALLRGRGWAGHWEFRVIEAGIRRGRNLIHDGPSILETARWLRGEIASERLFQKPTPTT
jgi:ABC-type Fe3+-hydroxamate transport system substrate-binding protein